MNRGRHKKNNTKKHLLISYNAKDLNKWKNFTLEELKCLIRETFKQQEDYAQRLNRPMRKIDLSIYERDWCTCKMDGGIDWDLTEEGQVKWHNLMLKLYN